jgi:hypothetical protein
MARPPKPKGESRDKLMQVRVLAAEYAAFGKAAKASGLDLSGWVRERLRLIAKQELEGQGVSVAFLPKRNKPQAK